MTDGSSAGDWRLPTKAEWQATVARAVALGCTYNVPGGAPALTNDPGTDCLSEGPTSFIGVEWENFAYWSSSTQDQEEISNQAWYMGLDNGVAGDNAKDVLEVAWPVRGGR